VDHESAVKQADPSTSADVSRDDLSRGTARLAGTSPKLAGRETIGRDDEAALEAAIDSVTRAIGTAPDEAIPALVAERRAMRDELRALQEAAAGVVTLHSRRRT
jgi:hypothetical protein